MVGVDPGKRELVVAVDQDDPKGSLVVRYTQGSGSATCARGSTPTRRGAASPPTWDWRRRSSPSSIRAPPTWRPSSGRVQRRQMHAACRPLRGRRVPAEAVEDAIKTQQSEERPTRLRAMPGRTTSASSSSRTGAGPQRGRPGMAANRGNAPCVGVGLRNKLAKRFVVAMTPEQYTSKTCCKCLCPCGPWAELEEDGRKVRGARWQNEGAVSAEPRCTGAANIGLQFCRLYEGNSPIRTMTDEEMEFHRLNTTLCVACD